MTEKPSKKSIKIFFTPEFKRNLRALSKKYRNIKKDIKPVLKKLKSGEFIVDQIPGLKYTLYKVRIQNSDIKKGKRSGYRFIYYLKTPRKIYLITIYSKSEQTDISQERIKFILKNYN